MNNRDVLVLGGGAAGLMAAVRMARAGLSVAVLEKEPRVGKKLLATGNGRCNMTNTNAGKKDYHGGVWMMETAMRAHSSADVRKYFETMGVMSWADEVGRVYPMGNQASAVLDALRFSASEAGAEEVCGFEITKILPGKRGFRVESRQGDVQSGRYLLCAMGGAAAENLGGSASGVKLMKSLGHRTVQAVPALVPVKVDMPHLRMLKGTKVQGAVSLAIDGRTVRRETGEMLFTEYGLSGICIMQLARAVSPALAAGKRVEVCVSALDMPAEDAQKMLRARRQMLAGRKKEHFLTGVVQRRFGQAIMKEAGALPGAGVCSEIGDAEISRMAGLLTGWNMKVTGTLSLAHAQVTAGGVDARDVDVHSLESKVVPGLYMAGEMLDVDGDCGGLNLQWAWASALTAADAIIAAKEQV